MTGSSATDRIRAEGGALVLVDYQQRLMPAIDRSAEVLADAVLLADIARALGLPVLGTEQNPDGLGPNDPAVRDRCIRTLAKRHFDACEDGLLQALDECPAPPGEGDRPGLPGPPDGARDVVIAGCEAHVCLLQTALGLRRAGHRVWAVASACGSRRASDHALAMQRLRDAGVMPVSLEMVAFEWLHSCRHPAFKAVLTLLKSRPTV